MLNNNIPNMLGIFPVMMLPLHAKTIFKNALEDNRREKSFQEKPDFYSISGLLIVTII